MNTKKAMRRAVRGAPQVRRTKSLHDPVRGGSANERRNQRLPDITNQSNETLLPIFLCRC